MLKIIVALKKEVGNLSGYDVYYSGCGKVNATISTMEAISAGAKTIINYGTAGAVGNLSGLIEPTGFVDRDMDVRPLGFELGQTPFEEVSESDTKELSWVVEILSQPVHQRSSVT